MSEARDLVLPPLDQDLKCASAALIRAYGGQVAAGELLGRAQSRYSDAGSRNTRVFLSIHEVAALEDRTVGVLGHPIVTRALARRQGYELIARPAAVPATGDLIARAGELARHGGGVMTGIGDALADREVSADEARRIGAQADLLIEVAVTLKAALDAVAAGDGL